MTNRERGLAERGAVVVELSIAVVILLTLVFGIITYGYLFSFKQGMTQAAAEAVRAGAVVEESQAPGVASAAAAKSTDAFGKTCDSGDADGDGLGCSFVIVPCVPGPPTAKCIEATIEYDYKHHPLLPPIPLISAFLPDTLTSTSIAEVDL